jgi:hypothetical protein
VAHAIFVALFYIFLLQFFWHLRRDVARAQASGHAMLTVVDAPPEVVAAGLPIGQLLTVSSMATMGRDAENTVVIPDEAVSATHLRLAFRNHSWWIEDLESTNGTFVNGEPVHEITRLADRDVIGCGPRVRLRLDEE